MEQHSSSGRDQQQTPKQTEDVPVSPTQPNPQNTEGISTESIKAKQDQFEERIKRGERWMIYLTAAIALFALGSVIVGFFQWQVMSGQLKEMQAAQRPWVSANIQIAGPLVFEANGSSIPLKITLKNTGDTPATRILAIPRLFVREKQPMDLLAIQKRRCEAGRRPPVPSGGIGYTLFPGDTVTEYNTPTMTHDEFGSQQTIAPFIVVCINYQFTYSGENHQTAAMYTLMRVDPTRPGMAFVIKPQDGSVPIDKLRFQFLGSYAE
jgi:hypothetical protein